MAKTKTPFLSLGAHGSVGEAITAQKRPGSTMLREKPLPTDPYSLPQAYQRWLYEDYAYLWRQQSTATRQAYSTSGSRFHLTGFQYWMKYHLKHLPDIVGMWHLDEKAGATAKDFSRNDNDATIFGASPSEGLIAGAQLLDGLNDYIATPANLDNAPLGAEPRTFECFFTLPDILAVRYIFSYGVFAQGQLCSCFIHTALPAGRLWFGGHTQNFTSTLIPSLLDWHYLAVQVIDSLNVVIQLDETEEAGLLPGPIGTTLTPFYLGSRLGALEWWKGDIDHAVLWNRLLDKTERDRHALRRYSL